MWSKVVAADPNESGTFAHANPFRFSTKYFDVETGLSYFGGRYYHAALGRWLNRDPIGELGGANLYAYAGNDPVDHVDPLGHAVCVRGWHGCPGGERPEDGRCPRKSQGESAMQAPPSPTTKSKWDYTCKDKDGTDKSCSTTTCESKCKNASWDTGGLTLCDGNGKACCCMCPQIDKWVWPETTRPDLKACIAEHEGMHTSQVPPDACDHKAEGERPSGWSSQQECDARSQEADCLVRRLGPKKLIDSEISKRVWKQMIDQWEKGCNASDQCADSKNCKEMADRIRQAIGLSPSSGPDTRPGQDEP